ncbi:MAG: 5-formyltetrahydrofolate cyclo-ligase [Pseudomonadota bacterium]
MSPGPGAADRKAALRKELFARRKAAHGDPAKGAAATARLLATLGDQAGRVVAGYRPIRTEIDPTPAMEALHEAGARLCAPVIDAAGAPLMFREWSPGCEMVEGPFKAEVPAAGEWLTPSALIVPLVGFDRALGRLGYGGGFYDRTLERLRAAGPTLAVGFAYAAQEADALPLEPTDQRLDAVATEAETLGR